MLEFTRPLMVSVLEVEVPIVTDPLRYTFEPRVEVPVTSNEPSILWLPVVEALPTARFCVKKLVELPLVIKPFEAKKLVEVLLVVVALVAKRLVVLEVLLFKLVNDALVAKKLVEVAFVVVAFVAMRSVKSPESAVRSVENIEVVVALVAVREEMVVVARDDVPETVSVCAVEVLTCKLAMNALVVVAFVRIASMSVEEPAMRLAIYASVVVARVRRASVSVDDAAMSVLT